MTAEVQEKWLKWVALTTTILAVCASFASLKGGGYSTQVQLTTTQVTNQWSFYQAKSVKLHLAEMERDLLQVELLKNDAPLVVDKIQGKIKDLEKNIIRYDKEKDAIKEKAEGIENGQAVLKRHGGNFGLAVMLLQVSIMLSAIGSLLKQRSAWQFGLLIGAVGIIYFINGFLLIF